MHSYVCFCFLLGQEWSKGILCKIMPPEPLVTYSVKNQQNEIRILSKHPCPLCAMIGTDKLRVY